MKLEGEIVDLGLVCDNWKELIVHLRNTWYKKWIFGGEIENKTRKPLSLFPSAKKGRMISKRCPIVKPRLVMTPGHSNTISKKTSNFNEQISVASVDRRS